MKRNKIDEDKIIAAILTAGWMSEGDIPPSADIVIHWYCLVLRELKKEQAKLSAR